jgi:hypothetical protein
MAMSAENKVLGLQLILRKADTKIKVRRAGALLRPTSTE